MHSRLAANKKAICTAAMHIAFLFHARPPSANEMTMCMAAVQIVFFNSYTAAVQQMKRLYARPLCNK